MTSLQLICEKIPGICDDQYQNEATNGLTINQVNVSNSIQIIQTKLAVTVVWLPFILFLNISTLEEFLISIGIMLQTFDAQYLNEFKQNFVVLTLFLKKICDLKLQFHTLVGEIFIIVLERFSFTFQRPNPGYFHVERKQTYPS